MHFSTALGSFVLFGLCGSTAVPYTAGYEDLKGNALGLPSFSKPPTPYLDLEYSGVIVATNSPLALITLNSTAGKNYLATNTGQFPAIKVHSNISSCTFTNVLAGTYTSTMNGDASPAVDSTLLFTGKTVDGKVVTQEFGFAPAVTKLKGVALENAQLALAELKGFVEITELTVKPIKSAVLLALTGVDLDNLTYTCLPK
ncbi:hypothetical protein EJ08DRAFT_679496 [Tothia fuscella]|uniref:Uncharacterized protein n=1 Tax=Tothia fuscella TaxID=1048955 RepID=A0A9P4NQ29_9PEZI|nr:hypothetical protein EJ08DRAFT_679496 [Tothia fuscella]